MLDEFGTELIKYEIDSIISETDCSSEYNAVIKSKVVEPIVRAHCVVKSEYGAVMLQTTYWSRHDWDINKRRGFYYAVDEALLSEEELG